MAMFGAIALNILGDMTSSSSAAPPLQPARALKSVGRTPREQMMEVISYVVSFSAFYIFVWFALRLTRSPRFRRDASWFSKLVASCAVGDDATEYNQKTDSKSDDDEPAETFTQSAARLAVCAVGIQISYLLWGLMQERIMTKPYESGVLFRSSKFLVFANRFLALFAAWCGLLVTGEPVARSAKGTPLYKFSFSSVSNILSSVCQYEALKFVSFPTQGACTTRVAATRTQSSHHHNTRICSHPPSLL